MAMPGQGHAQPAPRPRRPLAPGGFVVEHLSPHQTRITISAWSWAGVAGLLATFDTDLNDIHPDQLKDACRNLARRYQHAAQ